VLDTTHKGVAGATGLEPATFGVTGRRLLSVFKGRLDSRGEKSGAKAGVSTLELSRKSASESDLSERIEALLAAAGTCFERPEHRVALRGAIAVLVELEVEAALADLRGYL
jgi:hypothetical protein